MAKKIRSYPSEDIVVDYDAARCIHAAECVHGLPEVFDPNKRPWIAPAGAAADDLIEVIERCPTGALQYRRTDGSPPEAPSVANSIRISMNGPLYLSGDLRVALPGGEVAEETRVALCRCGRSNNKPYCDNAHVEAGFSDAGLVVDNKLKPGVADGDGPLDVAPAPNGPLLLRGPFDLASDDGSICAGSGGALCRCGHSANKPFCDGAHARMGFVAD